MKTILKQRTFTWMSLLMMSLSINTVQAATLPQATEQKINDITQMLHDNPQVVDNLHESLQRYIQQTSQLETVIQQNENYLYHNPNHPSYGAKNPDLTIVFFTDYSCPWCKKLDPVLHQLVEKYPQLKVVDILIPLKEMNKEVNSATFALNIWQHKPEAFAQTSQLLIKKPGSHDARSLLQVAKKTDTVALLDEQDDIQKQVNKNYQLFAQLGLQGTPALLIDGEIIPGYLPIEKLEPIIKAKLEK